MSIEDEGQKYIKIIAKFDEELASNMVAMKTPELKQRVLQSQANLIENERAEIANDKLTKAKVKYDDLKGPYNDAKKFQTAIIKFGMLLLEKAGVSLSSEDK